MEEKVVDVKRGLFLITYEAADNAVSPPTVTITVDTTSNGIQLITSPETLDSVLWSPGGAIIARADQPGRLRFAVAPTASDGSPVVRINVAKLVADPAHNQRRTLTPVVGSKIDTEMRLLGHLAGLGDVLACADQWIGGPDAPTRIEGFTIQWPSRPNSVGIRYSVKVGGARPAMSEIVSVGTFVGTRGKALPIVGAVLELYGPEASNYRLVAGAVFLGSPQLTLNGPRITLSGPSGREPLVGLKLSVESITGEERDWLETELPPRTEPIPSQITTLAHDSPKRGKKSKTLRRAAKR